MATAIERIEAKAKAIKEHRDPAVKPGQPERFTEACSPGDFAWQGDLKIIIVDAIPPRTCPGGFSQLKSIRKTDMQLVPGNTEGARHCLKSKNGVKMYRPHVWNEESTDGPVLFFGKEGTITHPVHGDVTIPAGFTVQLRYQREWNKEQQKARRTAD